MGINREILRLAVPSILANITVPLVGMVDIAVAGHLDTGGMSAAAFIGAIAVGSMLFDLLYWNFAFLRAATGGLTAQSYGRGDMNGCAKILSRSVILAVAISLALIAIQWLFIQFCFLFVKCTPEVRTLASSYFYIRIWAAPATLSLMALKGWFIGMQDTIASMTVDLVVNGVNIAASILLSKFMGFRGIATGTVLAQWCGLLTACVFILVKYRRKVFTGFSTEDLRDSFKGDQVRRFFSMNTDLLGRSICMLAIYVGYTMIAARYGDVLLAVSSIMMKVLMIFSYFTDGFAYAGEAMTGKYIGAKDRPMIRSTVIWVFVWSMGIAVLFMGIYGFGGDAIVSLMTKDGEVAAACHGFIPWLLLMPPFGCAAFTWDGIYLGATASKDIRNAMIAAAVSFLAVWFAGVGMLHVADSMREVPLTTAEYGKAAINVLMTAYFAHLLARTVWLSTAWPARWRKIL